MMEPAMFQAGLAPTTQKTYNAHSVILEDSASGVETELESHEITIDHVTLQGMSTDFTNDDRKLLFHVLILWVEKF